MKYLLLIHFDESWEKRPLAERQQIYKGQMDLAQELTQRGQYLGGNPLQPASSATMVRVREGKRLLTDGPFVETREHLGGYMLIDVADLDDAIAIAARGPVAQVGTVEVRAVRDGAPTK